MEDPWENSRAADLYPKYFLLGAEGLALALLSLSSKSMSITSQITSIELEALDLDLSTLNFSKSGAWEMIGPLKNKNVKSEIAGQPFF